MKGVFAGVDGGSLQCTDYKSVDLYYAYYKGYTCNVEVTNTFVLNLFKGLVHAGVKIRGSWYDSRVALASVMMEKTL